MRAKAFRCRLERSRPLATAVAITKDRCHKEADIPLLAQCALALGQ